jgi:molybdate transport system substrate-binding protein
MRLPLLAIAVTLAMSAPTTAAEIKVLCVGGVAPAIAVLLPLFESISGYKVSVSYVSPGGALRDRVLTDRDVDVALVPSPVLADIEKAGKIVSGSRVEIARTPLAVGIRAGAPKPDLSTPESVKHAVIAAKSIALSDPKANSPIGTYFMNVADRFGFGGELRSRLVLIQGGGVAVAEAVARGEAEMTVTLMSEILSAPGAEVAGPLPSQMQDIIVTSAILVPGGREPEGGAALIKFLTSPEAVKVFKSKGQDPR